MVELQCHFSESPTKFHQDLEMRDIVQGQLHQDKTIAVARMTFSMSLRQYNCMGSFQLVASQEALDVPSDRSLDTLPCSVRFECTLLLVQLRGANIPTSRQFYVFHSESQEWGPLAHYGQ